MNKAQLYKEFLPKLIKRMLLVGLPCVVAFWVFWYKMDGYGAWTWFLDIIFSGLSFVLPITYDPGTNLDTAAFFYTVQIQGPSYDIGYKVNNYSANLVVLVLLVLGWPHKNWSGLVKTTAWCLLFLVLYQIFSTWIQMYYTSISPGFADRNKIFWEPSAWHSFLNRIVGFDKFILRYYACFPIFGLALVARYFTETDKK